MSRPGSRCCCVFIPSSRPYSRFIARNLYEAHPLARLMGGALAYAGLQAAGQMGGRVIRGTPDHRTQCDDLALSLGLIVDGSYPSRVVLAISNPFDHLHRAFFGVIRGVVSHPGTVSHA